MMIIHKGEAIEDTDFVDSVDMRGRFIRIYYAYGPEYVPIEDCWRDLPDPDGALYEAFKKAGVPTGDHSLNATKH